MVANPLPSNDFIIEAERLDEALREDRSCEQAETDIPSHVLAGLRFLHSAFGSTRDDSTTRHDTDGIDVARPETIGRFRLGERLGAGSFGIVYRAFDTVLKRDVALKLPRLLTTLSDNLLERFLRESEAAGRLHHPHIVPVFEAGSAESTAYIAAQYCPGVTLKDWLQDRDTPVDPSAAAGLLLSLADAVDHAHQFGILHRDLKPSNVLLSSENSDRESSKTEILQSAKITDFGLARFLHEETATVTGEMVGTLAYMAPEQARGDHTAIGPECDIYSLGVILYELLTGRRPHSGDHQLELLRRICEERPVSPRRRQAEVPRDLESICLKCLEKQPSHRYRTAAELQGDLRRFLDGQATLARPLSVVEQFSRTARRHPAWTAVATGVLLAGFTAIAAVTYHFQSLARSVADANENRRIAEERQQEVSELLYVADMRVGLHALHQGNRNTFQRQMDKYRHRPELRGVEWEFLQATLPKHEHEVAAHAGPIYSSAVSPNGKLLATVGKDRVVRLWNLQTRKLQAELRGHTNEVNDVAFHPDGTRLASSSDDRTVRLWDLKTRKTIRVLSHTGAVFGVAFSPDGQVLASGGKGKVVRFWSDDGKPRGELKPMKHQIDQLLFSPDGVLGVVCDRYIHLWNTAKRRKIASLRGTSRDCRINRVSFSRDGRLIAAGCYGHKLIVWDRSSGQKLADWRGHRAEIHDVAFSLDGTEVVSCSRDGTVRMWPLSALQKVGSTESDDVTAPKGCRVIRAHAGRTWSLVFAPSVQSLVTTGHAGRIRFWPLRSIRSPRFGTGERDVANVVFTPDGRRAIVLERDGVFIWDVKTQQHIRKLDDLPDGCTGHFSVSRDGTWLAVGLRDSRIVVESLSGRRKRTILDFAGQRLRMSTFFEFSPRDNSLLISTAVDGVVRYWDVERGTQLKRFNVECNNEPIVFGFSNDGRLLAHADGAQVVVKDVATWRTIVAWVPISTRGRANSIAFSPDNRILALANPDHTIELRDASTGKITAVLSGHEDMVNSVVFSKNGRSIFSASIDGTVRAWHVASGQEIGVLFRDAVHIHTLRLSGSGRQLLAGHSNGGRVGNHSGLLYWHAKSDATNNE